LKAAETLTNENNYREALNTLRISDSAGKHARFFVKK